MSKRVLMNAPADKSGFSHDGEEYTVENGQITVRSDHVEVARSHGFTLASGEASPALEGRPAMVGQLVHASRAVAESLSDEQLIAFTSLSDVDQNEFWKGMAQGLTAFPTMVSERAAKARTADEEAERLAEEAEQKRIADARAKEEADKKAAAAKTTEKK